MKQYERLKANCEITITLFQNKICLDFKFTNLKIFKFIKLKSSTMPVLQSVTVGLYPIVCSM